MKNIFSNGGSGDFVINPFSELIETATSLYFAAPYFTKGDFIATAARNGKRVQLLIGLNASTTPEALTAVFGISNISIRYLTHRFHAKLFIFDRSVLIGSSNLTDGGLLSNRECVVRLDSDRDPETVEDARAVFAELWESGSVLTPERLKQFSAAYASLKNKKMDADAEIERVIGRAEPANISVHSREKNRERIFLEGLRRLVYEEYQPAFEEVAYILDEGNFHRSQLAEFDRYQRTNRFLNWVRLTQAIGEDAWQAAPVKSREDRRLAIVALGGEWLTTDDSRITDDYVTHLRTAKKVFSPRKNLLSVSKEEITEGLMSIHAFLEQLRFVKGGLANLPLKFWEENDQNVERVKGVLDHLLYGSGDFIERLHDLLYDPDFKLLLFAKFCALELFGTVKPDECPPLNGRMAKALRFLGFDVRGN